MKHDVADARIETIIAATDYVTPSLEILDTRILRADPKTGKPRKVFDTISDNAANAGIVLGSEKHTLGDTDLRWVGAILKRDDVVEETGLGAAVLDDPLLSMSWLVDRLATYGQKIRAGDIVLSGSFIKIVEAPAGSKFHADFGPFGSVSIDFA
jgi:2-oxo-hept-3-ene-1,7-dioate hydratase